MVPACHPQTMERTQGALAEQNFAGLERPTILEVSLGSDARALGAAALPLTDRFLPDLHSRAGLRKTNATQPQNSFAKASPTFHACDQSWKGGAP